jgi:hypothetical protein
MSEQNVLKLPVAPPNGLSNAERERLLKAARLREKVAKSAASARSAELIADFEQQLASVYSFDQDEIWAKAAQAAKTAVEAADSAIAEECERLGIPARFRPSLACQWYGRGENASKERRAELRKVAQTRIAANEKQARTEIDRISSEVQIELLAHGMSPTALALLEQMPKVDQQMPALQVQEVESMLNPRLPRY